MARAATTSDAFNAIAEPQRRDILALLQAGEWPVTDLAQELGMSQPRASKHRVGGFERFCHSSPFLTQTFVLTHRPRSPIEMAGGTTFHFLDASPADALDVAREAAAGQDVRIGGGLASSATFSRRGSSTTVPSELLR